MRIATLLYAVELLTLTSAFQSSPQELTPRQSSTRSDSTVPLIITNRCRDTIWPGIETQGAYGPGQTAHLMAMERGPAGQETVEEYSTAQAL